MSVLQKHLSEKPEWYKKVAEDQRLSYRAIGILVKLLAMTNSSEVKLLELARGEVADEVKVACDELMAAGYVTRQEREGKPLLTHVSNVTDQRWVQRNAAKDWQSKPPSPKPFTKDDRALAAGAAPTASEVELASTTDLIQYRAERGTGPDAVTGRVLKVWATAIGRNPDRVRANTERVSKVRARMAEGYTEEDLMAAVQGVAMSSWHMGENPRGLKYNDITLVLRDGANVEKFRDLFHQGGEQPRDVVDQAMDLLGLGGDR